MLALLPKPKTGVLLKKKQQTNKKITCTAKKKNRNPKKIMLEIYAKIFAYIFSILFYKKGGGGGFLCNMLPNNV
jgi:hypothetical protein